jgi:hypothetical protein
MKVKTTRLHTIRFSIEANWIDEDGDPCQDQYGRAVLDITTALILLEAAQIAHPDKRWKIVGDVESHTPTIY